MCEMGTLKFYWLMEIFAAQEIQGWLFMFIVHGGACGQRSILLYETLVILQFLP